MPVHLLPYLVSSGSSISLIHPNAVLLVFLLLSLLILRRWTNGVDLLARLEIRQQAIDERLRQEAKSKGKGAPPELTKQTGAERDLHGTTWLVVASLVGGDASPASLLVLAGLASRGAQLVVLLPSTHFHDVVDDDDDQEGNKSSKTSRVVLPSALQLLQLLRDGANNELIFAEECDLRDVGSVDRFVAKWAQGEGGSSDVGGLGAGPAAGGAASGLLNPSSGGQSGAGTDEGPGRSARRCDGVVLLPYSLQGEHRASYESLKREHLGRFHLVNSLLPSLLMLPPQRDIRIVQWVSPWYAAGVVRFEAEQREMGKQDGVKEGGEKTAAAAGGAAVNGGGARKRKGNSTGSKTTPPAAATSSPSSSSHQSLSVATYGVLTLDSLLVTLESQRRLVLLAEADPRPRNPLPGIMDETHQQGQNQKSSRSHAHAPNISYIPICPGFERVTEVWSWAWLGAPNSSTNGIARFANFIRRAAVLACWPLALILAKSPKAAADELLWGCVAPLDAEGGVKSLMAMSAAKSEQRAGASGALGKLPEEGDAEGRWRGILPGRLYRQGKVVRLPVREDEELVLGGERAERRWGRWEREVREGAGR